MSKQEEIYYKSHYESQFGDLFPYGEDSMSKE